MFLIWYHCILELYDELGQNMYLGKFEPSEINILDVQIRFQFYILFLSTSESSGIHVSELM